MVDQSLDRVQITLSEYLALPESKDRVELINGELLTQGEGETMSPAAKDRHENVIMRLIAFLLRSISPDELRASSTDLILPDSNVLKPDIFWADFQSGRCSIQEDGYTHGVPNLVIEVLSPATQKQDRGSKYNLYEKHGVQEYWLVDYSADFIEVYTLDDKIFARLGVFGSDETFHSPLLDQEVKGNLIFP